MPAPIVSVLPTAPARLSRPSSFVSDSSVFLEALPSYRTQSNQLATYINTNIINKYNYGKIHGIRYFPDISQTNITDIVYDNDSVLFTSNIDGLYLTLELHSNNVNSAGEWFDLVINEVGTIPYDLNKPLVSGVTYPMGRSQNRSDFNDSATLFSETAADNINSLYQSVWYTYQTCCGNTDYGLVTDGTIITTIDAGSVTDTHITY